MYGELMLQELNDDQLAMVNGGDWGDGDGGGGVTIIYNITIINSQLINSPVGSFDGNSNSTVVYSQSGNITASYSGGSSYSGGYGCSWGFDHRRR